MAHEPQVGEIYYWAGSTDTCSLFMVLRERSPRLYDCLMVRGSSRYLDCVVNICSSRYLGNATLFTGTLTDSEHRLAMTALLDAETYIWEHTA